MRGIWRRREARGGRISAGSLTNVQRSGGDKDPQPAGLASGGWLAALLLSHRAFTAMLLRRALPASRRKPAHTFPIYEMGSNECFHGSRCKERHPEQGGFPIPSLATGRFVDESSGTFGKKVFEEMKMGNSSSPDRCSSADRILAERARCEVIRLGLPHSHATYCGTQFANRAR